MENKNQAKQQHEEENTHTHSNDNRRSYASEFCAEVAQVTKCRLRWHSGEVKIAKSETEGHLHMFTDKQPSHAKQPSPLSARLRLWRVMFHKSKPNDAEQRNRDGRRPSMAHVTRQSQPVTRSQHERYQAARSPLISGDHRTLSPAWDFRQSSISAGGRTGPVGWTDGLVPICLQ